LYVLWSAFERFYIEGGGYATIQDVLSGALGGWAFLLLLFSLKLLSTSLSLGSGASGGVFSPSLFMGATLGAAYGSVLQSFFPGLPVTPPAFAVAGMAGMVGGVTGAALTTIVMLFEMTLDYSVVVPMIITVALSNGLRWFLSPHSIYTTKLARRGHFIPSVLQKNVPYLRRAKEIMETRLSIVPASCTVDSLPQISLEHRTVPFYLIEESHRLLGIATGEAALEALGEKGPQAVMEEIADRKYCLVAENSSLCEVLARMRAKKTPFALVSRRTGEIAPGDVSGVITDNQIWKAVEAAIELFAD
jgi:CIC family chloride channel protein